MAVTGPTAEKFSYLVTVTTDTQDQADQVMAERINVDEDYGFDYQIGYETAPEPEALNRAERTAFRWTHADLDAIAGRTLTDEEIERIVKAIEFSTAGEAVSEAVEQVAGLPDEDDEYDDSEDDIWDGVCGHCGATLRCDERTDRTGSRRCDDSDPNHRYHVPEGCEP